MENRERFKIKFRNEEMKTRRIMKESSSVRRLITKNTLGKI